RPRRVGLQNGVDAEGDRTLLGDVDAPAVLTSEEAVYTGLVLVELRDELSEISRSDQLVDRDVAVARVRRHLVGGQGARRTGRQRELEGHIPRMAFRPGEHVARHGSSSTSSGRYGTSWRRGRPAGCHDGSNARRCPPLV